LLVLGAVLCVVMGRRLGTPAAGLLAGLVYALDPLLAVSASLLYPDPPAALLLAGSLLLIWRDKGTGSLLRLFAGGSLLGAFVLFRLVGIVLVPPTVLYLLAGGATPGRRRTVEVAVLLAGWLLVVGPWVGQNHHETGRWLPIATAVRSAPGIGPSVEEQGVTRAVVAAATNDPAGFARRALVEFAHFWEPYPTRLLTDHASVRAALSERDPRLSTAPIARRGLRDTISAVSFSAEVILAVIGVWIGWRTRRRETLWLVGLMLSFALGYALFYGKIRYRIPVLPILFAFAGVGGVRLVTLIAARGRDAVTRRVGAPAPP
jgi:4-amino-4-deoxy-L-arabinose transferase-like glycosyltransferase